MSQKDDTFKQKLRQQLKEFHESGVMNDKAITMVTAKGIFLPGQDVSPYGSLAIEMVVSAPSYLNITNAVKRLWYWLYRKAICKAYPLARCVV